MYMPDFPLLTVGTSLGVTVVAPRRRGRTDGFLLWRDGISDSIFRLVVYPRKLYLSEIQVDATGG